MESIVFNIFGLSLFLLPQNPGHYTSVGMQDLQVGKTNEKSVVRYKLFTFHFVNNLSLNGKFVFMCGREKIWLLGVDRDAKVFVSKSISDQTLASSIPMSAFEQVNPGEWWSELIRQCKEKPLFESSFDHNLYARLLDASRNRRMHVIIRDEEDEDEDDALSHRSSEHLSVVDEGRSDVEESDSLTSEFEDGDEEGQEDFQDEVANISKWT